MLWKYTGGAEYIAGADVFNDFTKMLQDHNYCVLFFKSYTCVNTKRTKSELKQQLGQGMCVTLINQS